MPDHPWESFPKLGVDISKIEEYRPKWAEHVLGKIWPRDDDGVQVIEMFCEKCNAYFRATCTSGRVRTHVNNYALVHVHRDPMTKPARSPLEER